MIDSVIIIVVLLVVLFFFKSFGGFIYAVAIIDIFLRLLAYITSNLALGEISSIVSNNVPDSIPYIIRTHSSGIIQDILMWALVFIYIMFLYYTVRRFLKKKF